MALVDPPRLRRTLLLAGLLTLFAAGGFVGLEAWNAHLQAAGAPFRSLETRLDRAIPLQPAWVWPYLSYYALCFAPVVLLGRRDAMPRLAGAYAVQFGLAFLCFLLFPVRMQQPAVSGGSLSAATLRWVYALDPGYNVFPSLHTANACMIAFAFHRFRGPARAAPIWIWAVLVALSTLAVKQHYALDLLAGVVLGLVADRVALRGVTPWARPTLPGAMSAGGSG